MPIIQYPLQLELGDFYFFFFFLQRLPQCMRSLSSHAPLADSRHTHTHTEAVRNRLVLPLKKASLCAKKPNIMFMISPVDKRRKHNII